MWNKIVRWILQKRVWHLCVIGVLTLLMIVMAARVKMSYTMPQLLPDKNSTMQEYKQFLHQFGTDGNVMFVGVCDEKQFTLEGFKAWDVLSYRVNAVEGVTQVLSFSNAFDMQKDQENHTFVLKDVFTRKPVDQKELDSLVAILDQLPFYDGFLYNAETGATLMMIFFDKDKLNTRQRDAMVFELEKIFEEFSVKNDIETHLSGMPYIRTITSNKLKNELVLFSLIALVIASIILFLFYRSFKAMIFPMITVVVTVIWALGWIGLMGFEITVLMSMIPPLLIIIGVENSIFLTNKYHYEYRKHGNKVLAMSRAMTRIGKANLLTNLTTAIGFMAFVITGAEIFTQFAIIAGITILTSYVLNLVLLPIFFSFLSAPSQRQMNHLDNQMITRTLSKIEYVLTRKPKRVLWAALCFFAVGIGGVCQLYISGRIVDDVPKKSRLYDDMAFFEEHFKGIVPLEITIDTRKDKGVLRLPFLTKLDELQYELTSFPQFAKPLSLVEVIKFGKQAYYNGNPAFYAMPNASEMTFIMGYLPQAGVSNANPIADRVMRIFVDSTFRKTRVSIQMKNVSTPEIASIKTELAPILADIFDAERYDVSLTGSSLVFLEGTEFLTYNLMQSLLLALVLIMLLIASLFSSLRMALLAIVANLLPLLLTASVMGYFDIPLKISTILIFSIALGISVDNSIHFLSRYRLELRINQGKVRPSVFFALGESGFSMFYSSTILFFGFSIFAFSSFGGTQSIGVLVSLTLLLALLSNLLFLPVLLLVFGKNHPLTSQNIPHECPPSGIGRARMRFRLENRPKS